MSDPKIRQIKAAYERLRVSTTVVDVDLIEWDDHLNRPALEIVLAADVRVPPSIVGLLYDHDLGIADVSRQGPDHLTVLAC